MSQQSVDEIEEYEPVPIVLHDGEVTIYDPYLFSQTHNTNVWQYIDGTVWVLDNETLRWTNVEKPNGTKPEKRPNHLKAVK